MSSGFSGNLGYPIPADWNYDQFAEISGYAGKWDLDRVAHAGRVAACSSVLPSSSATPYPDPDPAKPEEDPLLAWSKKTERECLESLGKASRPIRACRGSIGEFILEWLRKPEYWGDKYGGLWRLYTPEIPSPSELESARQICSGVCKKQPAIKGLLPNRDVAHMAATAVGCLAWGIEEDNKEYGLGDLGGWPLDLLQIWGAYEREANSSDLAAWLEKHLGGMHEGKGFGYEDVLADADAWLIARNMIRKPSSNALTNAMRDVFKQSETHRIGRFYRERFGSRADNVVTAFKKVADGIDALGLKNIGCTLKKLLDAAHAKRLPSEQEAEVLARAYAAFLSLPHR